MPETYQTVFVVDDDLAVRDSLSRNLQKHGFLVQSFESATQFLADLDKSWTGCIVLDQGMPGMTGLELQESLNDQGHPLPIIFITGHGGVRESVKAMKAGAIDFLEKPFRTAELVKLLKVAFQKNQESADQVSQSKRARALLDRLTQREAEIVNLIVASPELATSKEIGRALDISPRTVDHHRARILEKLEIKSLIELSDLSRAAWRFAPSEPT